MPLTVLPSATQNGLSTLLGNFILKWQASDVAERKKSTDEPCPLLARWAQRCVGCLGSLHCATAPQLRMTLAINVMQNVLAEK
jgi:hypothetical protein